MATRYRPDELVRFATALFRARGLADDRAVVTAELLLAADTMGHDTHGLAQVGPYLSELEEGRLAVDGEPTVVTDNGSILVWDGERLPGVWLTHAAVEEAIRRARSTGSGIVSIRNAGHIGCLATFLPAATDRGCMIIVSSSDPSVGSVAPYGGLDAVMTPNPIAVGIPTEREPILMDFSASTTTNGMTSRLEAEGKRLPGQWVLDADGKASDDPAVLGADPPGTILPSGGIDHGHKGYALALMIEALTQGLSGFGRPDEPQAWGASVFISVFDPDKFAGRSAFTRVTQFLADQCHASRPAPGYEAVRLPGERGLERKRAAERDGVELYPGIMDKLETWARRLDVALPVPLSS